MLPHHRHVALKTAGGENDGIGVEHGDVPAAGSHLDTADATLSHPQPDRRGFVAKLYRRFCRRFRKPVDDGATASDRLDARRTGAEIVNRRVDADTLRPEPSERRG